MENINFVSKNIRELKTDNNRLVHQQGEIFKEMHTFYQNLYNVKEVLDLCDSGFCAVKHRVKKVNQEQLKNLEKDISIYELEDVAKVSKDNKSPGPDGFSNEFYKLFWPELIYFLLTLVTYYRNTGEIIKTQQQGIITCVPKGDKNRNDIKNWRSITLLNSIYNFFSTIFVNIIKGVLTSIIHTDQKGFIKGRFIGENIRLINDIIYECEV